MSITHVHMSPASPPLPQFPTSSGRWKSDTTSPRKKTRLPSPDPDSDYVDSGEEEEGEERRLAEVDISALPPPSKRKVCVETECLEYRCLSVCFLVEEVAV